jgi:hypothetical protein
MAETGILRIKGEYGRGRYSKRLEEEGFMKHVLRKFPETRI